MFCFEIKLIDQHRLSSECLDVIQVFNFIKIKSKFFTSEVAYKINIPNEGEKGEGEKKIDFF